MVAETRKLTRRIFIALGVLVAASVFAVLGVAFWFVRRECKRNHSVKANPVPDDHFRKIVRTRFDPPEIYNLHAATVDSTSAILTWATARESKFEVGDAYGGSDPYVVEHSPVRYHVSELAGLKPDTEYSLRISEIDGKLEQRVSFRTLPDAGEVLFSFAAFSDNHFKPDGLSWPDGRYFRRCSDVHRCLVRDLNAEKPEFLINKGDLTDIFEPYRLRAYREAVHGLEAPVHCIPGNHDHLRNKNFKADWLDFAGTQQVYRSFDHKGFHLVLLDTCWTGEQERGYLGDEQIAWLVDDLEQNASKRTFIFTHHPVNGDVQENRVIHDYVEFQKAVAQFRNVAAVFSAHVHRNYVTSSQMTPDVPYVETAAVIQYPMGYNVYQVSRSGIKQVFKKLSDISLSEESWLSSPLRCLTNPGDAMGRITDRSLFIEFPEQSRLSRPAQTP
ncbi:MAG: metallophosphoesterase [Candidatus Lindowbacteria bacterium]|nr:metallophosphoesterase [Candidatus Lindowbacteria bacterium]